MLAYVGGAGADGAAAAVAPVRLTVGCDKHSLDGRVAAVMSEEDDGADDDRCGAGAGCGGVCSDADADADAMAGGLDDAAVTAGCSGATPAAVAVAA